METVIEAIELRPFVGPNVDDDKLIALIEDAMAIAQIEAPCLTTATLEPHHKTAIKAIIRAAITRYVKAGESAALIQQQVGPYGVGFASQPMSRGTFYPSELKMLQTICAQITGTSKNAAFSIDTAPTAPTRHAPICSIYIGDGTVCTCGVVSLSEYPTSGLTGFV